MLSTYIYSNAYVPSYTKSKTNVDGCQMVPAFGGLPIDLLLGNHLIVSQQSLTREQNHEDQSLHTLYSEL